MQKRIIKRAKISVLMIQFDSFIMYNVDKTENFLKLLLQCSEQIH